MTFLHNIGLYILMLQKMFQKPTKWRVMKDLILKDTEDTVVNSLGIISFVSFFIGGVITIQLALSTTGSFYPDYLVGYATRETIILEFAPTIISIIMAGKVGSFITSSIGSMRVTEQIDALEIMGINSASFLILPKIITSIFFFPILVILSMGIGMIGAWVGALSADITTAEFLFGLKYEFIPFYVTYSIIKTIVFAYLITSISAYFGYHTKGGAINVGVSSTKAVVYSSILILIFNFILTDLILS